MSRSGEGQQDIPEQSGGCKVIIFHYSKTFSNFSLTLTTFSLIYCYEIKREVHSSEEGVVATLTGLRGTVILQRCSAIFVSPVSREACSNWVAEEW